MTKDTRTHLLSHFKVGRKKNEGEAKNLKPETLTKPEWVLVINLFSKGFKCMGIFVALIPNKTNFLF